MDGVDHPTPEDRAEQDRIIREAIEKSLALSVDGTFMVTGYLVQACYVTADNLDGDSTTYSAFLPPGQPLHHSIGLSQMMALYLEAWTNDPDA